MLRAVDQLEFRFENDAAGALAADKCASDVKPVLRQQLVKVVPRYPTRNSRESLANQITIPIPERHQSRMDLDPTALVAGHRLDCGSADVEPGAVVQQNAQLF